MAPRLSPRSQRGAAAVEFAIILPILILLVGGIIDFGFVFNAQIGLAHAAREGVRVEAIGTGDGAATAEAAFVPIGVTGVSASILRACPSADGALVRIEASFSSFVLPDAILSDIPLRSEAVMRCGG